MSFWLHCPHVLPEMGSARHRLYSLPVPHPPAQRWSNVHIRKNWLPGPLLDLPVSPSPAPRLHQPSFFLLLALGSSSLDLSHLHIPLGLGERKRHGTDVLLPTDVFSTLCLLRSWLRGVTRPFSEVQDSPTPPAWPVVLGSRS